jgi:hypothetical protein
VQAVFKADTAAAAHQRATELGIQYLYVGQPERRAHPGFETLLRQRPDLFQPVFWNGGVSLFFVERPPAAARGE